MAYVSEGEKENGVYMGTIYIYHVLEGKTLRTRMWSRLPSHQRDEPVVVSHNNSLAAKTGLIVLTRAGNKQYQRHFYQHHDLNDVTHPSGCLEWCKIKQKLRTKRWFINCILKWVG
jgi:hypothetical protein